MSARLCPKCAKPLPAATLRMVAQGTWCPFCSAPIKAVPRKTLVGQQPLGDDYAAFQVSATPPPKPAAAPPAPQPKPAVAPEPAPPARPPARMTAIIPPAARQSAPLAMLADSRRDRRRPLLVAGAALIIGLTLVLTFRSGSSNSAIPVVLPVSARTLEVSPPPTEAPPPAEVAVPEPAAPARPTRPVARKHAAAHPAPRAKPHVQRRVAMAKPAPAPAHAEAATPADAPDVRASYERGTTRLFAGESKGAIAAYREAVQKAPSDPIGYRGLGLAYEQKGDTRSALKALRYYLKLAPSAPDRDIIARRIDRLAKISKRK